MLISECFLNLAGSVQFDISSTSPTFTSMSPTSPSPDTPEVAGAAEQNSNCFYPNQQIAMSITVILTLLVILLSSGYVIILLCVRRYHASYSSHKSSEVCNLPPIEAEGKGALNLSFEDTNSLTMSQPGW